VPVQLEGGRAHAAGGLGWKRSTPCARPSRMSPRTSGSTCRP
jgi:hypothetical protein